MYLEVSCLGGSQSKKTFNVSLLKGLGREID